MAPINKVVHKKVKQKVKNKGTIHKEQGIKKAKKKWKKRGKIVDKQLVTSPVITNVKLKTNDEKLSSSSALSLRDRMMKRLEAARFRQMNEELDSMDTVNPLEAFGSQALFEKYHEAYKERIQRWPSDPLNLIIEWLNKKIPQTHVIADFGCGEARLAQSVPHTVHSFDLYALNERVTACDMSNVPLADESVDVAIFCLSLMGVDIGKFIAEASRVLKKKGILKVAEVSSRFQNNNTNKFIQRMKKFGFVTTVKVQKKNAPKADTAEVFYMFEFFKIRPMSQVKDKLPNLKLNPCLYKKR